MHQVPRVYMAGSMNTETGENWRNNWRPDCLPDDDDLGVISTRVHRVEQPAAYDYVGPWGNKMGNHSFLHGQDSAACCFENAVFVRALDGIMKADIVVALLNKDRITEYGTLAEIGFAHGLGKRIYVMLETADAAAFYAEGVDDVVGTSPVWFATSMAKRWWEIPLHSANVFLTHVLRSAFEDMRTAMKPVRPSYPSSLYPRSAFDA